MVVQKQWTYNQTIGQCVEFSYHPCGQDREGYDVFRTESECNQTCLQQGNHSQCQCISVAANIPVHFSSMQPLSRSTCIYAVLVIVLQEI